jgi:hypothetical protein
LLSVLPTFKICKVSCGRVLLSVLSVSHSDDFALESGVSASICVCARASLSQLETLHGLFSAMPVEQLSLRDDYKKDPRRDVLMLREMEHVKIPPCWEDLSVRASFISGFGETL